MHVRAVTRHGLQVFITHCVLFLTLEIIQNSNNVTEVIMNAIVLTFICDIDQYMGGAALRTLDDMRHLFRFVADNVQNMSNSRNYNTAVTASASLMCPALRARRAAC